VPDQPQNLAPGIAAPAVINPAAAANAVVPSTTDGMVRDDTADPVFQVVFLPDFEEQFAIRNVNFLAKSDYTYHFSDGWSLDNVSGTYNATDVPVQILKTLGNIINQASAYEVESIKARMKTAATKEEGTKDATPVNEEVRFDIQRVRRIEPGVYRIQKSWERVAAAPPTHAITPDLASSLLSDLGLPVVETVQVVKTNQAE
jgi:hypothetical protein